jgi:hypothetical protein
MLRAELNVNGPNDNESYESEGYSGRIGPHSANIGKVSVYLMI